MFGVPSSWAIRLFTVPLTVLKLTQYSNKYLISLKIARKAEYSVSNSVLYMEV